MRSHALIAEARALTAQAKAAEAAGDPAFALYRAANEVFVQAITAQADEIVQTVRQIMVPMLGAIQ